MNENDIEIQVLLRALGDHLTAAGRDTTLLVVGGAALALRDLVARTTQDVDVLGMRTGGVWTAAALEPALQALVRQVARDFAVREDWLNTEVAAQWGFGLPPDFEEDLEWREYGKLRVALAGRPLLVALKLFAAVDSGPESVHLQDLRALAPSGDELERAAEWVRRQDDFERFPSFVEEVVRRVRDPG